MNPKHTVDTIDYAIVDHLSDDAMRWRPGEWAHFRRPALAARIAADTGRDLSSVSLELDQLHHTRPDEADPARIVQLFAPTGIALGAPIADVVDQVAQLPAEQRGPVMATITESLVPAVVQAVLAEAL
ncbi:hypothetical protein Misp01_47430 [Microtetraspora sp. NBRC 13810]|uniref:hypothetical protein n=1 Tax=Microtetraspora sp. NBRC 13810 TaxID=3030990 RepID=UPI0024A08B06|nr:hypothetical protein [Microtetraspora sp. NBRC 13810]GLW09614.1 hypothetical protein Misp01_47430 [Microtetraspora sp. NBRC 13810]